jgi:16S rRNA (cytosine967-C5)-methyltransferase
MNARQVVTRRVAARASRFPDFDLRPLDTGALDRRDAALARAIDQGVARQWLALVVVLESRLTRAWSSLEPKVAAALLVGAAQLLLLERLPDHAVIHEAVEWAKMNAGPKAGGLVNAVLRRVSELRLELIPPPPAPPEGHAACWRRDELPRPDGSVWRLREAVFADDPWRRLAQQTSHPQALLVRWLQQFGEGQTRSLAAHSLVQAPIILSGLDSQGGTPPNCTPHAEPGFRVFAGDHTELTALLGAHPGARVQDPAAAAAMQATERLRPPPRLIIDFCAGQGTKTQQLAQLHPEARIIATDKRKARLETLRKVFAGHDRVEVRPLDRLRDDLANRADLVVLDVPCSNTGVLARRVEAKYRFSDDGIDSLVDLQRQIVADSIPQLGESGWLLYATCSLEERENKQQAEWIARWHRMQVTRRRLRLPQGLPGGRPQAYSDGGYFACLTRRR